MKNKTKTITCICFIILACSIVIGCSNQYLKTINSLAEAMPRVVSDKEYKRDSLYLATTTSAYLQNGYWTYSAYLQDYPGAEMNKIKVYIDQIYYSPDKLKLIAFEIIKVPLLDTTIRRVIKQYKTNYSYDGGALVGYRENTNQPWTIYPYTHCLSSGLATYNHCQNALRECYFVNLKDDQTYVLDSIGNWKFIRFQYNLNEPAFWKGIVWQKGLRIPGYYNFQLKGNYKPGEEKMGVLPYLKPNYPDSLLLQYK
jgi:hypothetical protein